MTSEHTMPVVFPKARQILFSGPMVRAILDEHKTQTRRVITPQPTPVNGKLGGAFALSKGEPIEGVGRCPYGGLGDRIWVREAWGLVRMHELGQHVFNDGDRPDRDRVVYRAGRRVRASEDAPADYDPAEWPVRWADDIVPDAGRWKPSIHMPRWASRITLEVTGLRLERVQDIDELDALAEGVEGKSVRATLNGVQGEYIMGAARDEFAELWDAINAKRGYPWESNPWVWVVDFKRVR